MLPVLTYTAPHAAGRRAALAPLRRSALARERAAQLGLDGRRVPVAHDPRTRSARATGRPARRRFTSTPTSPTRSSATRRRPADERVRARRRARAARRDRAAVALARTPRRRTGSFRIDGVTGPDEYSAIADNNVYTNLMAQRNLRGGRRRGRAPPGAARASSASTTRRWRPGATPRRRCSSPTTRSSRCTRRRRASPSTRCGTSRRPRPDQYPLLLHFPYFDLYRKQVVKQADLVLAMQLRGDAFSAEQKARNFDVLRAAHGARLVAVGLHAGGDRGRGRDISSSPTTTSPRRR